MGSPDFLVKSSALLLFAKSQFSKCTAFDNEEGSFCCSFGSMNKKFAFNSLQRAVALFNRNGKETKMFRLVKNPRDRMSPILLLFYRGHTLVFVSVISRWLIVSSVINCIRCVLFQWIWNGYQLFGENTCAFCWIHLLCFGRFFLP